MVNDRWCLFLNRAYDGTELTVPGGVYVPPAFRPVATPPAAVAAVRRVVFGSDPDLDMLTHRGRQFFAVWHAGPLAAELTADDPRIAYDPLDPTRADPAYYQPTVRRLAGTGRLWVTGTPLAPDATGRLARTYTVAFAGGEAIVTRVLRDGRTVEEVVPAPAAAGGVGPVPLAGSGYTAWSDTAAGRYAVAVTLKPERDLAGTVAAVETLAAGSLPDLFAGPDYALLRAYWASDVLPHRAAALAAALCRRTREARS